MQVLSILMTDMKLQDMKMADQVAGHENAGHRLHVRLPAAAFQQQPLAIVYKRCSIISYRPKLGMKLTVAGVTKFRRGPYKVVEQLR